MDGPRPVVDVRRDRPARPADGGGRPAPPGRGEAELRLRRGGLRAHADGLDVPGEDPDVVSVAKLHGEDVLAAEAVVGHEPPRVGTAFRGDDNGGALGRARALQELSDPGRVVHRAWNGDGRYGLCGPEGKGDEGRRRCAARCGGPRARSSTVSGGEGGTDW